MGAKNGSIENATAESLKILAVMERHTRYFLARPRIHNALGSDLMYPVHVLYLWWTLLNAILNKNKILFDTKQFGNRMGAKRLNLLGTNCPS